MYLVHAWNTGLIVKQVAPILSHRNLVQGVHDNMNTFLKICIQYLYMILTLWLAF